MPNVLLEMEKLKNPFSGLGQFCLHLGTELVSHLPSDIHPTFYVPEKSKGLFGHKVNYVSQSPLHKHFRLNSSEYDIWHCLHQDSSYLPSSSKTKLILTIHDLNFLEKYTGLKRKQKLSALQRKVDRASVLTTISHYTADIVRQNLHLDAKPLRVIHNGNSLKIVKDASRPDYAPHGEFIFSIGIISAKKNFHSLVPLLQKNQDINLIIAGNRNTPYAEQLIRQYRNEGLASRLFLPGIVNDRDKYWLYKNCLAFVFPSLTEGFGLPVVEAMSLGKPVFSSNLTSLPEIGGTHAYYWRDFDPEHMLRVFAEGLANYSANAVKASQITDWAKRFSWTSAANAYLELYRSLSSSHSDDLGDHLGINKDLNNLTGLGCF
jgi:glycosyltransferase involved in cell wall biosynthesis